MQFVCISNKILSLLLFIKKRYRWFLGGLVCYIILSVLTFGPIIHTHGELYFFRDKFIAPGDSTWSFVNPLFRTWNDSFKIPFIIDFFLRRDTNKNLYLMTFRYLADNRTEIKETEINSIEYHTKDGQIFNLLEGYNIRYFDNDMSIDLSKTIITAGDVLRIDGICKLKNGTTIDFHYDFKVVVYSWGIDVGVCIYPYPLFSIGGSKTE